MTPQEIQKLTEHARKAKALMVDSAKAGEDAAPILESYARTLETFRAHMTNLSKQDAGLQAALAAMGNAGPALDDAFRGDEPKSQSNGVDARPHETAHLPEVKSGN